MKDDRLYLLHISESLERIEEYVAEGRESFLGDRKTQDGRVTSGLSTEEIMALTRQES